MPLRQLTTIRSFVRAWLGRLAAMQFVDRATALAALAFSALIPLFIVYDAVAPDVDGRDFASSLNHRLGLSGAAADSVRQALAPPGHVKQSVGVIGAALVLVSALSFARALQRMYEQAFGLRALGGMRGTPATLVWLALVPAYLIVREAIGALFGGTIGAVLSLALAAAVWTVTPFVLLRRRVSWRALVPTGVLSAAAVSLVAASAVVWLTRVVRESAHRYGLIGVAFALLSWLLAAAFVLAASAAAGAVIAERGRGRGARLPPRP